MVNMLSSITSFSELPQKLHAGKTLDVQQCLVEPACLGFCLDECKHCSTGSSVEWHTPSVGNRPLQNEWLLFQEAEA